MQKRSIVVKNYSRLMHERKRRCTTIRLMTKNKNANVSLFFNF